MTGRLPTRLALLAVGAVVALGSCRSGGSENGAATSTTRPVRASTTTSTTTASSTTTTATTTTPPVPPSTATATATATTATTTTIAATTTSEPPPSSVTTAPITRGAGSPEQAAQGLYVAWRAGDRAAAATVATTEAVDALFARAPRELAWTGCREDGTVMACGYGGLAFRVQGQGGNYLVVEVNGPGD